MAELAYNAEDLFDNRHTVTRATGTTELTTAQPVAVIIRDALPQRDALAALDAAENVLRFDLQAGQAPDLPTSGTKTV